MLDLEPIKERCEAATSGPWEWHDVILREARRHGSAVGILSLAKERNRLFISHAREDLPACVEEIEQLRATVDAQAQELQALRELLEVQDAELEELR